MKIKHVLLAAVLMGSISATVPVLLTKAPITAVTSITSKKSRSSLVPASFITLRLIILASPVCTMAPPTTKSPTIMMTTELENPDRASSGVRIWKMSKANNEHSATKSERNLPATKKAAVKTRIMIVPINIMRYFYTCWQRGSAPSSPPRAITS